MPLIEQYDKACSFPSSTTLANFVGSVLSHSLNTGYTVRAYALALRSQRRICWNR